MNDIVDPPTGRISPTETNTTPRIKTVVVSVVKDGGDIEYAIAPLKTSYPEGVSAAVEALKNHLGNLAPDDISLKIGAKNVSGQLIWASFAPSMWEGIVSEGSELRICQKSAPTVPTQVVEHSVARYTEPRPLITLVLPGCSAKDGHPLYMTIIAPKSYDEARTLAFNLLKGRFKNDKTSWDSVILRGLIQEGTQGRTFSFQTLISAYGTGESPEWVHLITQMKKEHPNFKVLIY